MEDIARIATLYSGVTMGSTRDDSANDRVNVNADATRAELSAYVLANPLAPGTLRTGRPAVVGARTTRG